MLVICIYICLKWCKYNLQLEIFWHLFALEESTGQLHLIENKTDFLFGICDRKTQIPDCALLDKSYKSGSYVCPGSLNTDVQNFCFFLKNLNILHFLHLSKMHTVF